MGLAAPQVGVNVRLMVFNEAGEKGKGEEVGAAVAGGGGQAPLGAGLAARPGAGALAMLALSYLAA